MDIEQILENYQPTPGKGHEGMSSKDKDLQSFLTLRIVKMINKKWRLQQRWTQLQDFKDVYLRLLDQRDSYNSGIRFPTAFGISQRLYSEFLESMSKVCIKAMGKNDNKASMAAMALEKTLEYVKRDGNYYTEHARMIQDVVDFGNGIKFIGYDCDTNPVMERQDNGEFKSKDSLKEQVYTRRVDPRRFYIDEVALTLQDPATYIRARDCVEDRIVPISYFKKYYCNNPRYRNTEYVQGVARDTSFYNSIIQPFNEENIQNTAITTGQYVHLYSYYNQEQDLFVLNANGFPIYDSPLEDNHKKLPYVHYKMYNRNDSVWANGALEVVYNLVINGDILNQLAVDNMRYMLQTPTFVSGDLDMNPGKQAIQPGAIIRINGLKGGKLSDSMVQFPIGKLDQNYTVMKQIIGDEMTVAIGDDARGLYANPNQLATQTAYKERVLSKRLKATVKLQEYEAVRYETEMMLSLIKQYLIKDKKGKKPFIVDVEGYKVAQGSRGGRIPTFEKSTSTNDSFELTKGVFDTDYKILVVDNITEAGENEDTLKNTMAFMQQLMGAIQLMPDLTQRIDIFFLVKNIAEKLKLDTNQIFPYIEKNTIDDIDKAMEAISLGIEPKPLETPSIEDIESLLKEQESQTYANFKAVQKKSFEDFLMNSMMNLKSSYGQEETPLPGQVINPQANVQQAEMQPTQPQQAGNVANSGMAKQIGTQKIS